MPGAEGLLEATGMARILGMARIFSVGRNWSVGADQFGNTELRLTAVHNPPYLWIHPVADGSYRYEGYLYDVWETMAQTLNLRYRLVPLFGPAGEFGRLDVNGTWTGLVGELAYGRADVALTWLRMRQDRLKVISFLDAVPVEQVRSGFYISKDMGDAQGLSGDMFSSLLKPLHTNVWWVLLVTLLVLSLVLLVTVRLCPTEDKRVTTEASWGFCLFSVFRCLVGQGWTSESGSLPGRTVTMVSWCLCIIILASYTATLASHLTVVTEDRPIKSLKDFSERPDWRLAMNPNHVVTNDWKLSKDRYERELYQHILHGDRFVPFDQKENTARELIKPKTLLFLPIEQLFYLVGNKACRVVPLYDHPIKEYTNYIPIAREQKKLRRALNQLLQKMNEVGILTRLKKTWFEQHNTCDSGTGVGPFSLKNALALLMILPAGIVASCILCTLEWMFRYITRKQTVKG